MGDKNEPRMRGARLLRPGVWQIRVYAGMVVGRRRYRTKVIHGSAKDVELERARMLLEVASGEKAAPGRGTIGELLEEWWETFSPTWSESTQDFHRLALDKFLLPAFGGTQKRRLTTRAVEGFHARLRRKGLSWAYIKRINDVLSSALGKAVEWGELPSSPVPRVKVPRHEVDPPELSDALALVDGARLPELARAFTLSVCAGVRRGELCGLQVRDLDEDAGELLVRRRVIERRPKGDGTTKRPRRGQGDPDRLVIRDLTKGNQPGRRIPLDPLTLEVIKTQVAFMTDRARACGGRFRSDAFLFSHEPEGRTPWRPGYLTQEWIRHRGRAGEAAAAVRLHDLRHTYASELYAGGLDDVTASKVMGHSRPTTTSNIYAHLRRGANARVAGIMTERLGRAGKETEEEETKE